MKIVSWHPVLTDHQSYTLAALQQAGECSLKVYVLKMEHAERQAQGWVSRHASSLTPELIPQRGWIKFAIRRLNEHRDSVHLFSSPFEQSKLIFVLLLAVALGLRVYLISEPYSPISMGYQNDKSRYTNWLKAKLRPLLYCIYGRLLRRRLIGVFAISCRAIAQYQSMGIAREKIFPFGYFISQQDQDNLIRSKTVDSYSKSLKLVFVGNLIARKGLDLLISAVKELNSQGLLLSLDVYGAGDPNQYKFDQSLVQYCGLIPFGNVQSVIAKYDVLVLPSRYDGWGVVVNEALMAGVPVICSNQVGAGAVVEKWKCGDIFASEDESDLAVRLKLLLLTPPLLNNMRLAAINAGESLNPKVAGQYMYDIISQDSLEPRILISYGCPWYECK